MEGKVIKEEHSVVAVTRGPSPCSSPLLPASSPSTNVGVVPPLMPPGKENRRVGSPLYNTNNNSSEILTRSRSKDLGKESSNHSLQHHSSHNSQSHDNSNEGGITSPGSPLSMPSKSGNSSNASSNSSGGGVKVDQYQFGKDHISGGALNMSSSGGGSLSPPVNGNITPDTGARATTSSAGNNIIVATSISAGAGTRTPSSSSSSTNSSNVGSSNGTNPAVHLRHILKIKRFLGTLLHFGCEINPEVGERVRNLVFSLVSGHLSIEEFHHSLQEATSFPLRPFVLPFLRVHLPILQKEICHLASMSKQAPLSYIESHDHSIIDTGSSPGEPCDIFHSEASDMNAGRSWGPYNGKRKLPDSLYENGDVAGEPGYTSTPKRHHGGAGGFFSPPFFISSSVAATSAASLTAAEFREYYTGTAGYPLCSSANNSASSSGAGACTMPSHHGIPHTSGGGGVNHDSASTPSGGTASSSNGLHVMSKGPEDEWKNIHVMLNCILSMVEKTKRALSILQNRTLQQEQAAAAAAAGDPSVNSSSWLRRPPIYPSLETNEELKRQTSEMIAQALRVTEDRVSEVKRRAEEAVQDVKRQALVELKRAVAAAEARACETVAVERARLDRILMDGAAGTSSTVSSFGGAVQGNRRAPAGEIGTPLIVGPCVDPEACWNCGRKAHETCSGCNVARYCSSFCQHKDWENHHTACGRGAATSTSSATEQQRERLTASSSISGPGTESDTKTSSHLYHSHHHLRENGESRQKPNGNGGGGSVVVKNANPLDVNHSPGSTN